MVPRRSQIFVIDQIIAGLGEGIHHFVILKCRQALVTTIALAFDLYWCFRHDGTNGLIVADQDERKSFFRSVVSRYVSDLPADQEWRQPVLGDNESRIEFGNRSRLLYSNANQRVKGALGRGLGLSLLHGSEVAYWSDDRGYKSMMAALAKQNPHRLFILESTANGNNLFRDLWRVAGKATSQRQIFVGWWLVDSYVCERDTEAFKTYWDERLSSEETHWASAVRRRYGWQISAEQWAWWRFTLAEEYGQDTEMMLQEYPPLPEEAFQFSGNPYIRGPALNRQMAVAEEGYEPKRFYFGFATDSILSTRIEISAEGHYYDLEIYREPVSGDGVLYVIGHDPSHGVDQSSDLAVASVWRGYTDKLEQVAEFAARGLAPFEQAWVLLLLARAYSGTAPTLINIEMQGGGAEVMQEIERVQNDLGIGYPDKLSAHFPVSHYYFRRPDSFSAGFSAKHYQTTGRYREHMLMNFKSHVEREIAIIRSPTLVNECASLVRTPEGNLEPVSKSAGTDRLFAAALASVAFTDNIHPFFLAGTPFSYDSFQTERAAVEGRSPRPEEYLSDIFQRQVLTLSKR